MGKVTVYCIVSGCTPEIASNLLYQSSHGPVVTGALRALADQHELSSQDDLCIIGPMHPSGEQYARGWQDSVPPDFVPDIRVVTHCVMGELWDFGFVNAPPPNKRRWRYLVSYGCALMVQTYALDIMALATRGRLTPLRLWLLAMQQGFGGLWRPCRLGGVEHGEVTAEWQQFPNEFPGFTKSQLSGLEKTGDVEIVKQRMVHEGLFWIWMAPDRFPVSPTGPEHAPWLPEVHSCASRSAIESLPLEVLILVVSSSSLTSLLNLASTSRSLRTAILGNNYLVCAWIYDNAPWWIPVPTQTPQKDYHGEPPVTVPQAYLASQWSAHVQLAMDFPAGLDWAYIRRCIRSGSMRNRRRIWNAVLEIEYTADLAGV